MLFTQLFESDFNKKSQDLAESTSKELRLAVYQVILDIHFGAKYGDEMIDTVTDELGDYFDDVEASDDAVLKKVYAYVRREGAEAEGDPARMDQVALNAIEFLNYDGARGSLTEGSGNIGLAIKSLYQKIYAAGDDEIEYFYNDSPIFAQYWDEYEGDLDSIIAEVDPGELQVMLDELESYVQQAGLAEGIGGDMAKLIGIPVVAGAAAIGAQHYDQQQPHVQIGDKSVRYIANPGWGRVPDDAMTLTGKDGKQYRVWKTSGKGGGHVWLAAPAEEVKEGSYTRTPSGDYINQHTGVRSSRPPAKKKRGEKTGAEWDAIEKAKKDKQQGVAEGSLNEFAPPDSDDDRNYEYEVYQCNPNDQFDWIGGPIYKSDDMGKVHSIAYNLHKKHPDKAFMIWQERSQGSRGGYGIKDDEQGVAEDVKLPYPVRSEKLGRANMELLIRAYNEPTGPRTTLSFGDRILELDRQDIEAIAHYYDNVLKDDNARWNFITGVMSDPDGLTDTLVKLGRRKAQAARQPGLFQEADKKKEDDVKDVALQRAISKSRAAFPTATSGFEALAKQFMQDQDADQRNFDKVKNANRRQDQLLAQISQIDKEQSQEINDLDKENNSLVQQLQQLQSVNSKLEKTLASMSGKKSKDKTKDEEPKTASVKPADELPVQKSTGPSKPQTSATAKPSASPQIAQAEPTQPSTMSSMTKQLTTQHPEVLEPAADYVRGSAPRFNTAGAQDVVPKDVANNVKQNIGSIGDAMVGDKLQQVANDELMGQSSQADDDNLPLFAKKQAAENKQQKPKPPEADYGDDYQAMVARVKKLAGMGPLKTVYDPQKRVYRNIPTAVQPKK